MGENKMTYKKKITIIIIIIILLLIGGGAAVVSVLASRSAKTKTSNIEIYYRSQGVYATVSLSKANGVITFSGDDRNYHPTGSYSSIAESVTIGKINEEDVMPETKTLVAEPFSFSDNEYALMRFCFSYDPPSTITDQDGTYYAYASNLPKTKENFDMKDATTNCQVSYYVIDNYTGTDLNLQDLASCGARKITNIDSGIQITVSKTKRVAVYVLFEAKDYSYNVLFQDNFSWSIYKNTQS